jgi:gluconolactonase
MALLETLASGYGLVEGPVWHDQHGLLFSDVLFGGVFAWRNGVVTEVVGHRRGIGGMAWHEAGGLVVSGRNIAFKRLGNEPSITLLDRNEDAGLVGFNDLTTDHAGRVYAGGLGASPVFAVGRRPRAGDLWLIDLDGTARIVMTDIQLTNGLGFSPDGRTLFHSDSRRRAVNCYTVLEDGSLTDRRVFITIEQGVPDGLVVDQEGTVWVALADGGHGVAGYGLDGRQRGFIRIPEPMCTSVCFGGDDRRDLYIVSGSNGTGREKGGAVHRMRMEVPGVAKSPARITIPQN